MAVDTDLYPKLGRLKTRAEFLFVRDGRYAARRTIVIQARANPAQPSAIRAGYTATKKIGNAVIRNRAKRRMRELARTALPKLGKPGFDYVFIARKDTSGAPWREIMADVEKALSRLH